MLFDPILPSIARNRGRVMVCLQVLLFAEQATIWSFHYVTFSTSLNAASVADHDAA